MRKGGVREEEGRRKGEEGKRKGVGRVRKRGGREEEGRRKGYINVTLDTYFTKFNIISLKLKFSFYGGTL